MQPLADKFLIQNWWVQRWGLPSDFGVVARLIPEMAKFGFPPELCSLSCVLGIGPPRVCGLVQKSPF